MIKVNYNSNICSILMALCLILCSVKAFPSPDESITSGHQTTVDSNARATTAVTGRSSSVGEARQAAILAALGAVFAPLLAGLFSPLLSQLASLVSNAVLGKLQGDSDPNSTAPFHYDAYMINMPNQPGPYLFLTTPTQDADKTDTRPTSPSQPSLTQSQIIRKTPKISQHLGTVNIKPNLLDQTDGARQFARDLRIPTPSADVAD